MVKKRTSILGILVVVVVVVALVAVYLSTTNSPKGPATDVLFTLDYTVDGAHSPFFLALDKGYWVEEGLNVDIVAGNGSEDDIIKVDMGQTDFGHADMEATILALDKGAFAKQIGAIYTSYPTAIFALKESGITTPKDLEGKTIAVTDPAEEELLKAFFQVNNVDASKVNIMIIEEGARTSVFLAKQIDACTAYVTDFIAYLEMNNIEYNIMRYKDFGFPLYGNGFITSTDTIQKSPDLVRKFLKGAYRGWQYAIDHRDEAVDSLIAHNPELNKEEQKVVFDIAVDQMFIPSYHIQNGWGHFIDQLVQQNIQIINELVGLETDLKPSDVYTNDYLPSL